MNKKLSDPTAKLILNKMRVVITKNEKETKDFAEKMAEDILSIENKKNKATILALEGVLGAGKTTFTQGFASGLQIKEEVKSPTFLIMKEYDLSFKNSNFKKFYHIDCYRLEDGNSLGDIGLLEILKKKENLLLIEWAGNIKKILPKDSIKVKFYYISENKRKISIT